MQKRVLITAGPTREKIDAVRFLSNRSSGKMGFALAEAARDIGFAVTLVSGPVNLPAPMGIDTIFIESAAEMAETVKKLFPTSDITIMAAAVADYRPKVALENKMKKKAGDLTLELERTEDILKSLGEQKKADQLLIGFAAETDDLIANAQGKLRRKNLDAIIANDISPKDSGMGAESNEVTIISKDERKFELTKAPKNILANQIISIICKEFL